MYPFNNVSALSLAGRNDQQPSTFCSSKQEMCPVVAKHVKSDTAATEDCLLQVFVILRLRQSLSQHSRFCSSYNYRLGLLCLVLETNVPAQK